MRIVHLEAGRRLYGGARQAAYLIEGLARAGVDNVLICPRGSAIASSGLPAEVVALPLRGDLDLFQTGRLARTLTILAPDLLHVHSRRGADLYGGLAARRAGVPAVLTRRVESAERRSWGRLKFRAYARMIAISAAIRRELIERFGLAPASVSLVPSAVDTERFQPARGRSDLAGRLGLPAGAVVIGNVAQLIARKGHGTLLEAFARVAAARPHLYLLIFGRGPLERRLERRIAELGLTGRARLAGFRDDLPELLPQLALLVHPAEREGLGLAVLEGFAAGVPVVATCAGGLPEIVENGVTGLLVPPGDADALAHALSRLLDDGSLRSRLAERGRQTAIERYSIERMTQANLSIYGEVIETHGTN